MIKIMLNLSGEKRKICVLKNASHKAVLNKQRKIGREFLTCLKNPEIRRLYSEEAMGRFCSAACRFCFFWINEAAANRLQGTAHAWWGYDYMPFTGVHKIGFVTTARCLRLIVFTKTSTGYKRHWTENLLQNHCKQGRFERTARSTISEKENIKLAAMDTLPLRREVVDTLTRDLAVSPNKWSTLMTELSEVKSGILYLTLRLIFV